MHNLKVTAVKGMNDVLPNESHEWLWLEGMLRRWLFSYGYMNIRTPIVEDTALFIRSIGEVTDIVEKEMYTFIDELNGDSLTLRPEGTAGTLRAVIEHNLLYNATQKLWYIGPMFRHERPQKGRYRQFHQLGVEALGFSASQIDSEMILMLHELWHNLGLGNIQLQINCLGNHEERLKHRSVLIEYLASHIESLDADSRARLYINPLRILDTKVPDLQHIVEQAPRLAEFLGDESRLHHEKWMEQLTRLNIPFIQNHRLVRGLDYYNQSVFEWVDCSGNLGAQATLAAGGRYDPLIKTLGGVDNYAIGFAIGLERLMLTLRESKLIPSPLLQDVVVITMDGATNDYGFKVARLLRSHGFNVVQNLSLKSIKSQLKQANSAKIKIAIIVGENEVLSGQVVIKSMGDGMQYVVNLNEMVSVVENLIKKEG